MSKRLDALLDRYKNEIAGIFGENLTGIYLTGSIVLDGFHEGKSDVDCTVLLTSQPNEVQAGKIRETHRVLSAQYKDMPLESQYIVIDSIQKNEADTEPFYSYHDGNLTLAKFNANPVTWFTLKKYGHTLTGTPAADINIPITIDDVKNYVKDNVNSYWASKLQKLQKPFSVARIFALSDQAVEWCTCGISRMYYTLRENDIASKDMAAEYSLMQLPSPFHRILKEALHIRTGKESRQYRSRFKRREDMIQYMKYMIKTINEKSTS